ncbi:MAG: filamentous hemagglutinin N-terminal domain-containing protein [Halochromatium sp.]
MLASFSLLWSQAGIAEIVTDGTVGPVHSLSGAMMIDEGLGRRAGNNLFHSFRLFSIATGESATFTGSPGIANVINRVTGGSVSTIDGLLKSEIGDAGFFLINPAGVVFGPHAQVDVPGAFHTSTADRVNFADGYYSATDTAGSTLSIATPESFGFLAQQRPADIQVKGSQLELKPERSLSMVAGNVAIDADLETLSFTRIASEGGAVRVVAVGASNADNRVLFHDGSSDLAPAGSADISWTSMDVSGSGGPQSIVLRADEVAVSNASSLAARHRGNTDTAGTIRIDAEAITITDSVIDTTVSGQGRGTDLALDASGTLRVVDSIISADNLGEAPKSAPMRLRAGDIEIIDSDVRSLVAGAGAGADIEVTAGSLTIDAARAADGLSRLRTRILDGATGTAGTIRVTAQNVALTNGGQISSVVEAGGSGTGGDLNLEVGETLLASGFNVNTDDPIYSGLTTTTLSTEGGQGGGLTVTAPDATLRLVDGAFIQAGTAGGGDSGAIDIAARRFSAGGAARVFSSTHGPGAAGDVHLDVAESMSLHGGASIESSSWPEGAGPAGSVSIRVGGNLILDDAKIDATTSSEHAAGDLSIDVGGSFDLSSGSMLDVSTTEGGNAGRIDIEADSLTLVDSNLWVASFSAANAGVIDIKTRGDIHLETTGAIDTRAGLRAGNWTLLPSSPFDPSRVADEGRSGEIRLTAANIGLDHDSLIDISTGRGNGGTLDLAADSLSLLNGASINAFTMGPGKGGEIRLSLNDRLTIEGKDALGIGSAGISTSSIELNLDPTETPLGASGAIDIDAAKVNIGDGGQILSGSFSSAASGDIDLRVGSLEVLDGGEIRAGAGGTGAAGDIRIHASERIRVAGFSPDLLTESKIEASAGFGTETGQGTSGNILLTAPDILIESGAEVSSELGSSGLPGTLAVSADRLTVRSGGEISASTFAEGAGGLIDIRGGDITLDGRGAEALPVLNRETGIFSKSALTTGDAGTILVRSDGGVDILGGAALSTSTSAAGDGGDIRVQADSLRIDDATLMSRADSAATGLSGNIEVAVGVLDLTNRGEISIAQQGSVAPGHRAPGETGQIAIAAEILRMDSASRINAESSGNVPAGAIDIKAANARLEGLSQITTQSTSADGGPIDIAAQSLFMTDSQVTTSVLGAAGDGGDIGIGAELLVMNGGFVQANTAASGAKGGDIEIRADRGLFSHNFVQIGGNQRFSFQPGREFNVIQAAAPAGVQGDISLTVPQLDITKGLTELATPVGDPADLVRDHCLTDHPGASSSLVEQPVAGIPPGPAAPTVVSFAGERLDRLLAEEH